VSWLAAAHPIAGGRAHEAGPSAPDRSASTILGTVREQAVRFRGLFGVVTEPVECTGARARTAVLLLNVGANHRIGSNRMYVRWARAWAELGFRVLRLDFAGMGDSPALTGRPDKDVYSPNGMKETRAAIDFLAARGCDNFVLGGLCSGAYVAYYTALEDARVGGIIVVNPPTFHWKEGDSLELRTRNSFQATRFYARRAFDAQTWRRALKGEVHVRAVATELARRMLARARSKAADALVRLRIVREPDEVARGFSKLCARGCEVLLVYGSNDGGIDVMEGHLGGGARKLRHRHTFRLEILEGTDHTFTPRDAQMRLERLLTRYLAEKSFASPPSHRRDELRQ
jgi:pimeloyl-ACP methyl ester carboxylesterase